MVKHAYEFEVYVAPRVRVYARFTGHTTWDAALAEFMTSAENSFADARQLLVYGTLKFLGSYPPIVERRVYNVQRCPSWKYTAREVVKRFS